MAAKASAKNPSVKILEKQAGVLNTKQMKQKDLLAKAKEELASTTTELREVKAKIKAVKKGS
jgi:peptidoglycan hydrolase CwlO-like protein